MRLISARVTNFKSIRDSEDVSITDLTCLVGKNESGKTAFLDALYRLNPIEASKGHFNVTEDYPRSEVEDYQQALEERKLQPAKVIVAVYELAEQELSVLEEELGEGALTSPRITIWNGYENKTYFSLDVSEKNIVSHLIDSASLPEDYLSLDCRECLEDLIGAVDAARAAGQAKHTEEMARANSIEDPERKAAALASIKPFTEPPGIATIRSFAGGVRSEDALLQHIWAKYIKPIWPKFLYFDEYYQMEGHLNIDALKQRQSQGTLLDSDKPMLGLIDLARISLDALMNPTRTEELTNKLEGASNHLSKQVLKYWSQNEHIRLRFDVRPALPKDPPGMTTGTNLWGRVYDSVHQVTTPLGRRSKGFIWFFSFLAWFSQQRKVHKHLILLLDEPGLFLHAKAQADLLKYIEAELLPHHQVVYTTHSPFMIDPNHWERVRIVEDKSLIAADRNESTDAGTKITTDVLEVSESSLFPLQGALGYDLAQTLFIGPNSLVVEGVSDLLFLQAMSSLLEERGMQSLNLSWTITPVGGADKLPTFAALLGSQRGMTIAALLDVQAKDRQKIEALYQQRLLKKSNILTCAQFATQEEADIEDLFTKAEYLNLFNKTFENDIEAPLKLESLPRNPRILVQIEKAIGAKFNHFRPAKYFVEHLPTLAEELSQDTLKRFEKVFATVNALLSRVKGK